MEENANGKYIYIAGAHSRGRTLGTYLTKLYPEIKIAAYLYDNGEPNRAEIGGVPVIYFDEKTELDRSFPVYLGTRGEFHAKLEEKLRRMGMNEIIPVTPELDIELRNRFLPLYFAGLGRKYERLDGIPGFAQSPGTGRISESACIYVARSVHDRPLEKPYALSPLHREIQAGAALSDEGICGLADDEGENISGFNRQFCELTAMYWIWKNAPQDIVGLEHYRRHFLLGDGWEKKMRETDIDAILPTPLYVAPSVAQNYMERHISSDWDFMMGYMKQTHPDYYGEALRFFGGGIYSPCNMFIMRKEILDELCAWLFPIIFACAERGGERADAYQNRYPGFLSERLVSLFFEKNRGRHRIVYADKNFLK